jgi:aryl-alcohol dehydrogenase-like predicted oxidoreductase
VWPAAPESLLGDVFPYSHIVESTETSLRNLGVERIDLQQLHVWNPAWTANDEWRRAFEDLKTSGKIRFAGISLNDHQPDSALEVIETGLLDTVQVIYNIFDQTPENNLFPACLKHNVGVLARCPFDEGSLTGSITEETEFEPSDFRAHYFRDGRKREVVERVAALERDLATVPGTLAPKALRFCLSHRAVSAVIPGMRKVRNVESSCAVSRQGALPEEAINTLRNHVWKKNFYA